MNENKIGLDFWRLGFGYLQRDGFPKELKSEIDNSNIQYYAGKSLDSIKKNLINLPKFDSIDDYSMIYLRVFGEFRLDFKDEFELNYDLSDNLPYLKTTENFNGTLKLVSVLNENDSLEVRLGDWVEDLAGINFAMIKSKVHSVNNLYLKDVEFFVNKNELLTQVNELYLSSPKAISLNCGKVYRDYWDYYDLANSGENFDFSSSVNNKLGDKE